MNCEICEMKFDHTEHKPLVIIPCTHTYCLTCLNRLTRKKCPKCDILIQKTNPNWSLINLIPDFQITKSTSSTSFNKFSSLDLNLKNSTMLDEATLLFNKGLEKYYQKEYKESVEFYDQAIKLNSSNILAYNNKGISLKELKDFNGAIEAFNKAINIDSRFEKAYNNLGRIYFDIRNFSKAIECFDKAIEVNPNYVLAYHNRGLAYHALKNYPAAISSLTKAIKLDETYYEAHIAKGLAIKQLKNEIDSKLSVK